MSNGNGGTGDVTVPDGGTDGGPVSADCSGLVPPAPGAAITFDITAIDSTTGKNVWTWSANQTFLGAVQDETVPGNGALVYSASWKPAANSRYLFHATLASTSARAEAYTAVVVP